ncbi:MAG: sensor domain-containing diguanylate cyclase [bacterium]
MIGRKKTSQAEPVEEIVRLRTQIKKLQENLRRSQAIIKAVFENSPVGITVRLGSGKLVSFNKAWKKIWNLTYHKIAENERKSKNWNVRQRYPFLKDAIPKVQRIFDKGGEIFLPEIHVANSKTKFDKWISQHYYAIKNNKGRVEHIVTITQDITEQKRTLLALQESEAKFRTIVNNVNLGVYRSTVKPPGYFIQVNPAFVKMFGYNSMKQILKTPVERFYKNPKDRMEFVNELMSKGEVRDRELLLKKFDGSLFWASIYAKAHFDENGDLQWIDGVIEDITERKRMTETLHALSFTDELTGLYNRRGFLTLTEHQMKIADRTKKPMFLLFVDMDNLKDINDEYGHPMGDQALIQTTRILKKTFRGSDIIARIGGDEFVVLTLEMQKTKGEVFYRRLQKSLDIFNESARLPFKIALSGGWAYYDPKRPRTIIQLLKQADRMMYLHKQKKKRLIKS